MMYKFIFFFISLCFIFLSGCKEQSTEPKIGIVIPIEHKALQEIVTGFTTTLSQKKAVHFKIMNAQGDMNIQRSMIQQLRDQHYQMIVPIATGTSQMTLAMVHTIPIVSLAAELTEADRQKLKNCNIAIVHDEIPPEKSLQFIHTAYPHLTQLTLIHSSADKIFPEVKEAVDAGKKLGIEVKPMMATTLPDLTSISNNLPSTTQGIFILKDNLIASGIATLVKKAKDHHILLITSDQGSVLNGAHFALGVPERKIGEEGAELALQILSGKSPCDLPIKEMTQLTLFINENAFNNKKQSIIELRKAAEKLHYQVEIN